MTEADSILATLVLTTLAAPAFALAALGLATLWDAPLPERSVHRIATGSLVVALIAALAIAGGMLVHGTDHVEIELGHWFVAGDYRFEVAFLLDRLSAPFVVLVCALVAIVSRFSATYLHREPGYRRFYMLMLLFACGLLLVVLGGSIDLLFAGWELVGLSSTLLIAFFHGRADPPRNALRTYTIYRFCDLCLLWAAVLIHHGAHTAQFTEAFEHGHWPLGTAHMHTGDVTLIGVLLVLAAMGKSAQVPFGGWLPRAMEGPTPSSAIFYGGLSIHLGAYMLLRMAPIFDHAPVARGMLIAVGALTAIYATLVGRVQTDAKNQLAHAAMAQVGLILIEIGAGLRMIAVLHIMGHASLRTLQFLRTPSILRDFNRVTAATGGKSAPTGIYYEMLLPVRLRRWLYAFSLQRAGIEGAAVWLLTPLLRGLTTLARWEDRFADAFVSKQSTKNATTETR